MDGLRSVRTIENTGMNHVESQTLQALKGKPRDEAFRPL